MANIISFDIMKWTKDTINSQPSDVKFTNLMALVKANFPGVTHISFSIPLNSNAEFVANGNNPSPRTPESFTDFILATIHNAGFNAILRTQDCSMEQIYNFPINPQPPSYWIGKISPYLTLHKQQLRNGDILAIYPEADGHINFSGASPVDSGGHDWRTDYNNLWQNMPPVVATWSANNGITITQNTTVNGTSISNATYNGSVFNQSGSDKLENETSIIAEKGIIIDWYNYSNVPANETDYINWYKASLDFFYNLYGLGSHQIFIQEWGDINGVSTTLTANIADKIFFPYLQSGEMFGINFWNFWDSPTEGIITQSGDNFILNAKGVALSTVFKKWFSPTHKYFGVAISGADFGADLVLTSLGTMGINGSGSYWYDTVTAEYQYFMSKGLSMFRLPFRWERLQNTLNGPLSTPDLNGLISMLDTVKTVQGVAILDCHNYGRFFGNQIPSGNDTTLADFWKKIAGTPQINQHPALYGYELMNEPHDLSMGSSGWAQVCQSTINAIRTVDTTHYIFVPGYQWQSGDNWAANNPNFPLTDQANKLIYSSHIYFDGDASGGYFFPTSNIDTTIGTTRLSHFTSWLTAHNQVGFVSEGGIPFGPNASAGGGTAYSFWAQALDAFLNAINTSSNVIGFTPFGAGLDWGNWNNTVEPLNNGQFVHVFPQGVLFPTGSAIQDQPSMQIYQKYPSTGVSVISPPPAPTPTPTPVPTPTPTPVPQPQPSTPPPPSIVVTSSSKVTGITSLVKVTPNIAGYPMSTYSFQEDGVIKYSQRVTVSDSAGQQTPPVKQVQNILQSIINL